MKHGTENSLKIEFTSYFYNKKKSNTFMKMSCIMTKNVVVLIIFYTLRR